MTDKKNTEVIPASEPVAPVQEAPVVVRERRGWFRPLISALIVVAALVVGGIGGFAIATATQAGGRVGVEQGQLPGAPGQGQSGPGMGGDQSGERPQPPSDQSGGDTDRN
jgi:uncharacterized membrane protein